MTDLRTAAQQALEALEWNLAVIEDFGDEEQLHRQHKAITDLRAALAEPVQEPVAWMCSDPDLAEKGYSRFSSRCEGAWNIPVYTSPPQRPAEPVQEPPCATRECMPSECPNCVSLQDQNTELDRKLADLEQTSLELCNVCGWRTLIPGDCCLNCERHPLGQASTDVPLTVYVVKKAHEP